jgi:hypothetical protein
MLISDRTSIGRLIAAAMFAISLLFSGLAGAVSASGHAHSVDMFASHHAGSGHHPDGGKESHHCGTIVSCGSSISLQKASTFYHVPSLQTQVWLLGNDRIVYSAFADSDPPVPRPSV